jgi:threonine dehydrogenase-like Zn-dependent dehydrogenase
LFATLSFSNQESNVKALTWHGKGDVRCERVADPTIQDGRDAIIKVSAAAICGSDLHIYDGIIPSMKSGDILGHETMGEVVDLGPRHQEDPARGSRRRAVHDRVRRMLLLQPRLLLRL